MKIAGPVRVIAWVFADLLAALIGTAWLISEIVHIFPRTLRFLTSTENFLDVGGAAIIGVIGFMLRPHQSAKWIWIGGIVLAGSRVISLWYQAHIFQSLGAHPIWWEMSGAGCESRNLSSCETWMTYTIPSTRMISYSAGAWLASVFGDRIRDRWRHFVSMAEDLVAPDRRSEGAADPEK